MNKRYEAFTDNGREPTGKDVYEWAEQVVELGAGEILITSIDKEGTGKGYDLELIKNISESVQVPVIACGGCGRQEHIVSVIEEGSADAASCASLFHYNHLGHDVNINQFKNEGNIEFIKRNRGGLDYKKDHINPMGIKEVKNQLHARGIKCREIEGERSYE